MLIKARPERFPQTKKAGLVFNLSKKFKEICL